jgi:L-rhamnose mutarotase
MTNVKLARFRFKPDAKQNWLDWSEELKRRKEEVVATLKNEGVVSESCFISNDGNEIFYFMAAEDFEKARKAVVENPHPIDRDHKEARESSLEFVEQLDLLFHFENRD